MPYNTMIRLKQRPARPAENDTLRERPAVDEGSTTHAAWLSDDVLLLAGALPGAEAASVVVAVGDHPPVEIVAGEGALWFSGGADGALLLLSELRRSDEALRVEATNGHADEAETTFFFEVTTLQTLVRERLAGLPADARTGILAWLTTNLLDGRTRDRRLVKNLRFMREALRERLPVCKVSKDEPQGMHVGSLLAVDAHSVYTRAWMWDAEADIVRLTVESPEGYRAELIDTIVRHPRLDILKMYGVASDDTLDEQPGFISYFRIPVAARGTQGWLFEIQNSEGLAMQAEAPELSRDLVQVRRKIVADLNAQHLNSPGLLEQHTLPALRRIQEQFEEIVKIDHVYQYGTPPAAPDVSVVIPLYGRIDLVEHQLAQFVHDAHVFEADLVYVLDSPELADQLTVLAAQLYRLYRVPFRVALLTHNGGLATARNLGASLARGRKLLMLDSDTFPDTPGWLQAMSAFYEATPKIGALGAKLLFEDDALQHAGLHFYKHPQDDAWEEAFYYKGLHRRFPGANVARAVPAVTGACLMVDRALYEQLGGLETRYIEGGCEDTDLCLRLLEAGYENWYLPEAELYHLEGQSYPADAQERVQLFNRWMHTQRWHDFLEARYSTAVV